MKQLLYFQTKMKNVEEKGDVVIVSGYASTGDIDRGNDRVLPEAFKETISDRGEKSPIPMLLQHDGDKIIGNWPMLGIDEKGLIAQGELKYDIDDCKKKVKNGDLRGLSIGYRVLEYEVEDGKGNVIYNSETGLVPGHDVDEMWTNDSIRVIKKIDLVEISIVSTPMNPYAFINSVKDFFATEKKDLLASLKGEEVKGEETPSETPEQEITPATEVEKADETPAPAEDTPAETPAQEESQVVQADQEPKEEEPKALLPDEVKALVDSAVADALKSLRESLEKKHADELTSLTSQVQTLEKKLNDIDTALSQEVFPERKSVGHSYRPITYRDLGLTFFS